MRRRLVGFIVLVPLTLLLSASVSSGAHTSRHQVVTIGAAQGIDTLNPATATFAFDETYFSLLWAGLTRQLPNGGVGPDLAKSYTQSTKSPRWWTFRLKHGIRFSNGKAITANAVARSIRYYLNKGTASQWRKWIADITRVRPVGKHVLKIKTATPDSTLPTALTEVKVIDMSNLKAINEHPNVDGPFKLKRFIPSQTLELVRNDKYWGPKPRLQGIKFVTAADPTSAVTSLKSGAIQIMYGLPLNSLKSLKDNRNLQVILPRGSAPSQTPVLEYDTTSAPFNNLRARQALAYAVDRKTMLKVAMAGFGILSPENNIVSSTSSAYNGKLKKYNFNLNKAKSLFQAAGVTHLTCWTISGAYPQFTAECEVLQADLAKIGIRMDIASHEISTWAAKFFPAGKSFPGLVVPNYLSVEPQPSFVLSYFYGGGCTCNWKSKKFDNALDKAKASLKAKVQRRYYDQAQAIVNSQLPLIIPYNQSIPAAAAKTVKGLWMEGSGVLHLENARVAR